MTMTANISRHGKKMLIKSCANFGKTNAEQAVARRITRACQKRG